MSNTPDRVQVGVVDREISVSAIKAYNIMSEYATGGEFTALFKAALENPKVRMLYTGTGHGQRRWFHEKDLVKFCKKWSRGRKK